MNNTTVRTNYPCLEARISEATSVEPDFCRALKKAARRVKYVKILTGVKEIESAAKKAVNYGFTDAEAALELHDLVRGAILLDEREDFKKMMKGLKHTFTILDVEERTGQGGKPLSRCCAC